MISQKSSLFMTLIFCFILSACNPEDMNQDEVNNQDQDESELSPVEPPDSEEPEIPEVPPTLPHTVTLAFNKNAYGFYSYEPQRILGTITKGAADRVRLIIDEIEVETVDVIGGSFQFELEFFDPTMGNLLFQALSTQDEVMGEKEIFYQVIHRPGGGDERFEFNLAASQLKQEDKLSLWATSYWLPRVESKSSGFALRDMNGNSLGAMLTRREWCDAAMEGSIQVKDEQGILTTYNYAGTSSAHQVDCSAYYNHSPSHKVKFRVAHGEYGDGVQNYKLVPFRSIAVDPNYYPYGSVIYIPAARGNVINLPNGETAVHDGYFYAVDTGGLIKANHIDVFRGIESKITQSWIKSNSSATFSAYLVDDPQIKDYMERIHR